MRQFILYKTMTIRLIVLSFVLFSFTQVATANTIVQQTIVHFSPGDFSLKTVDNRLHIMPYVSDYVFKNNSDPALPFLMYNYAVDSRLYYYSVSVSYNVKFPLVSQVEMAQNPKPEEMSALQLNASANDSGNYTVGVFPDSICQYSSTSQMGEVSMLHFLVTPFVYDASIKTLFFIPDIVLTITLRAKSDAGAKAPALDISKNFVRTPDYTRMVAYNKFVVDEIVGERQIVHYEPNQIDYLIITNEALKEAFVPLLQWKRTKGVYTEIQTIEEISSSFEGADLQEKIKNCIYRKYRENKTHFVLLGGDDAVVPVRYAKCTVLANSGVKSSYIPADNYYVCFSGEYNWDKNNNRIYGEVNDKIDLSQSLDISRLPVRTKDDVANYINKLLRYEKSPRWANSILLGGNVVMGKLPSSDTYYLEGRDVSDAEGQGLNFESRVLNRLWGGHVFKFFDTYTPYPQGADYDFTADNLMQEMSKGYDYIQINTHGSQQTLQMEKYNSYHVGRAMSQQNIKHSVITTSACLTNAFDTSEEASLEPSLSEALIRSANSGIVAYLGCSRYGWSYASPQSTLGPSMLFEEQFYKALLSHEIINKNFATIVAAAKATMIGNSHSDNSYRWLEFGLNAVGDAEVPLFTSAPKSFDDVNITVKNDSLMINTNVPDSRVCIMSASDYGDKYYKVYENAGQIKVKKPKMECTVCITKQNYIPQLYTFNENYLQNVTLTGNNMYNATNIYIGSDVSSSQPQGPVEIQSGTTEISADKIVIKSKTSIDREATVKFNSYKKQ